MPSFQTRLSIIYRPIYRKHPIWLSDYPYAYIYGQGLLCVRYLIASQAAEQSLQLLSFTNSLSGSSFIIRTNNKYSAEYCWDVQSTSIKLISKAHNGHHTDVDCNGCIAMQSTMLHLHKYPKTEILSDGKIVQS